MATRASKIFTCKGSEMKNILVRILIFISLYMGLYADNSSKNKPDYQDTWYRLYDAKHHVFDMFYSNEEFWKDEPVIIIIKDNFNGSNGEGIAEGFFSQKKREILICTDKINVNRRIYTDKKTKKALQQRVVDGYTAWNGRVESGIKLPTGTLFTLNWSENAFFQLKKLYPEKSWNGNFFGESSICEPMSHSIRFINDSNEIIWEKSVVRYYFQNEETPESEKHNKYSDFLCIYEKQFLSHGGGRLSFILTDNTILVSDYPFTYIVRLNLKDGSTGDLPNNLKVIDQNEVAKAKEKFIPLLHKFDDTKEKWTDDNVDKLLRIFAEYFFNHPKGDNK